MTTPPPAPAPNSPAPNAHSPYAEYTPQPYRKTNTLAIVAIILGFAVPIGGIITGHIAMSQIKQTGEAGRELALAGTIIGYVLTALGLVAIVVWIAFTVFFVGVVANLPPVI